MITHLQKLYESYVSVNNKLCEKSVSSLTFLIKFDKGFKVTSVPFYNEDSNLLSYELDNFTIKMLH